MPRRQMLAVLPCYEVPTTAAGRKKGTKKVDMPAKIFDEIAPKYADRKAAAAHIIKRLGAEKGRRSNGSCSG